MLNNRIEYLKVLLLIILLLTVLISLVENKNVKEVLLSINTGIISGTIVSVIFEKISERERIKRQIQEDYRNFLSYLYELVYEINNYLDKSNREYKEESYENIKKMVNLKPKFDSFKETKFQTDEFLKIMNNITVFFIDFNNELVRDIKRKDRHKYMSKIRNEIWEYIEKLQELQTKRSIVK